MLTTKLYAKLRTLSSKIVLQAQNILSTIPEHLVLVLHSTIVGRKPDGKSIKSKQRFETFARTYVSLRFNGKQAAIAAGYSPRSAESMASALLRNPKVMALIAKFAAPTIKKEMVSVERTLTELARMAYIDAGQLVDENNKVRPIHELPAEVRACIAGFDTNAKGRVTHVKLTDKARALYMLCQCLKMFSDDRTPTDLGVKYIVLDVPRPVRQVGAGAAALLPEPANGNGNGNGSGSQE